MFFHGQFLQWALIVVGCCSTCACQHNMALADGEVNMQDKLAAAGCKLTVHYTYKTTAGMTTSVL